MESKKMNTEIEVRNNPYFLKYNGFYGEFGGAFVPPILEEQLMKLSNAFDEIVQKPEFKEEYIQLLKDFVGRPSSLYYAKRLSEHVGSKIYLKREDLNHTGSHKINNAIGQILIAKYMGATEIIAETGAGQHGVATATAAALLGLPCKVFMGVVDVERQHLNVKRMQLLGAEICITSEGRGTLKDAVDAALNYYISNPTSFYLLGSHVGPHPYPKMVGYFQSVIGEEAKQQFIAKEGCLPNHVIAPIGGGSNAIGLFSAFIDEETVKIHGAEGGGLNVENETAATLTYGKPLVFQGTYSMCLVDAENNPVPSRSIAAGLDYPGISPQHAFLSTSNRANYYPISDQKAIEAYHLLSKLEGIIPAIESAHAIALAIDLLKDKQESAIVNLSGRGDKDVERNIE